MKYYSKERNNLTEFYWQIISIAGNKVESDFSIVDSLPKKKQEKIRQEISRFCDENTAILSDENKDKISPQVKLSDILAFLATVRNENIEIDNLRREDWIAFASGFSELLKNAVTGRFHDSNDIGHELNDLKIVDGKVRWNIEQNNSFEQIVTLFDPIFSENYNFDSLHSYSEIDKADSGFIIEFIQSDYDETEMDYINEQVSSLSFSDLELETVCFNYSMPPGFLHQPWRAVCNYLFEMENKNRALGEAFLNDKERALLPLAEFSPQNAFSIWPSESVCNGNVAAVELFISLAEEAGNQRVAGLAKAYSKYVEDYKINVSDSDDPDESHTSYKRSKEEKRLSKKLTDELKKVESEALYRLISNKIKEATAEYPIKIERDVSTERLNYIRTHIAEQIREKGFEGEYPNFKKLSPLRGIKLLEINGQPVIVCNEKNMVSCIDCFEDSYSEQIVISYAVSTIFLQKDQLDLYNNLNGDSGFFIDKHRRRMREVTFNNYNNDLSKFDLQKSIDAAVKTSQCERLTKSERKEYTSVGPGLYGCFFYGGMFLFTGILFGLLMCPGLFLVCLIIGTLVTVFSSDAPSFIELVKFLIFELPWLWLFLFCVVGFGLPMTVITAISKKRG